MSIIKISMNSSYIIEKVILSAIWEIAQVENFRMFLYHRLYLRTIREDSTESTRAMISFRRPRIFF